MDENVKLRLYVSVAAAVVALLYVGPFLVLLHGESLWKEILNNCHEDSSARGFDLGHCWHQSKEKAALPFWYFLLPYFPAALLIWLNWLLKPGFRLSAESFPKRTIQGLMRLGLVGALVAVIVPLWGVATQKLPDIAPSTMLDLPWLFGAVLTAPLLFNFLVGPVPPVLNIKKEKIALLALVLVPVVAFAIFVVRVAAGP